MELFRYLTLSTPPKLKQCGKNWSFIDEVEGSVGVQKYRFTLSG